ncbi:MAG: hypothetical protein HC837_12595 [Chloroflexaceae bacterium]|nr:hypothetical protein [Chloroflexaceae bacterium]
MKSRILLLILALFLISLLVMALPGLSMNDADREKIVMVDMIFSFLALSFIGGMLETRTRNPHWQELADRTGLDYCHGNMLLGQGQRVTGCYRGRTLTFSASRVHTYIEIAIQNENNTNLRLFGPFDHREVTYDRWTHNVFAAMGQYQVNNRHFFIGSEPRSLAKELVAPTGVQQGSMRSHLPHIRWRVRIAVDGYRLTFEQMGLLQDMEYIQFLFELLSDLADVIERTSAPQQRLLPVSPCE